ncbi:hypothetical protein ACVW0Y_004161 [Pseudomonas sp. TE3786]
MNKAALYSLLLVLPSVASATTPWIRWNAPPYATYVRLDNKGDVSCYSIDAGQSCHWESPDVIPPATAASLSCGANHKRIYGISGYESSEHWCNQVFGDYYATWKRGDYFGFNTFLSENPQGDLICASNDGEHCAWDNRLASASPEKPIKPVVCRAGHSVANDPNAPADWCSLARVMVDERDYSSPSWARAEFKFDKGWFGQGFGLTGNQRGAPESIKLGEQGGHKGLAILSLERDANWYQLPGNARDSLLPLYGAADNELQDDLYMYGKRKWVAADEPVVVIHVYLPKGNTTSLRMPLVHCYLGTERRRWPGIWLNPDGVSIRTVIGDYLIPGVTSTNAVGSWWTLGMKVTAGGDIEYYGVPEWRTSPFAPSLLLARQSTLLGTQAYRVIKQADATVMISSVMPEHREIVIADIRYGMKTKGQKQRGE